MRSQIQIGHRTISDNDPLFVIAEIGVTCNYDMAIAKELIDAAAEAQADAVKFIFWFPEEIMSDKTITYSYKTVDGSKSENMFEMLQQLRFTLEQWLEIKAYADEKNIIMFSTVNSPSGIDYAEKVGLDAFKLSSWDFNYHTLWRRIAAKGKPMLIDTGPVNTLDVAKVMHLMKDSGNDQSVLIHCIHTDNPKEINMRSIPYMKQAFNTLVGYSSSDTRDETDIMAVSLGACVIEKRLTMSRNLEGHHHVLSKEPDEFKAWVRLIRDVQLSLGVHDLRPSDNDLAERRKWFRHLVVNRDLKPGETLTVDMLEGKRPETAGISPEYIDFFIGKQIKRALKYNQAITLEDV